MYIAAKLIRVIVPIVFLASVISYATSDHGAEYALAGIVGLIHQTTYDAQQTRPARDMRTLNEALDR